MRRALVHTCKRATDTRIKHIWFPEVCAACKKYVDEHPPKRSKPTMAEDAQTPDIATEPTADAAPDEPSENPGQLPPAEAAPDADDDGGASLPPTDPLASALALLEANGYSVVSRTTRDVEGAGDYTPIATFGNTEVVSPMGFAKIAAPSRPLRLADDGTPIATEDATIYERDFGNGTAVKVKDATGVWYRYEGKRYNRCVSDVVEGERLIDGYRYLLKP